MPLGRLLSGYTYSDFARGPGGAGWRDASEVESPFDAGVGDAEALALGVALGVGAGLGHHHGQIASSLGSVPHARGKQSGLQAAPAEFGDGGGSAEEGDAPMEYEDPSRAGNAVRLGKEAGAVFARQGQSACVADELGEFRVFVGPAAGADAAPEVSFIGSGNADSDSGRRLGGRGIDGAEEDVADLKRAVAAAAEGFHRRSAGEGADLLQSGGAAQAEEGLDAVEAGFGERGVDAEAEGLGGGGVNTIEDDGGAVDYRPLRAAVGEDMGAGLGKSGAGEGFCCFESPGKFMVGEKHDGPL